MKYLYLVLLWILPIAIKGSYKTIIKRLLLSAFKSEAINSWYDIYRVKNVNQSLTFLHSYVQELHLQEQFTQTEKYLKRSAIYQVYRNTWD